MTRKQTADAYLAKFNYCFLLSKALEWDRTSEKFTFVLDEADLTLTDDGDSFCSGVVNRIEDAFEDILDGFTQNR